MRWFSRAVIAALFLLYASTPIAASVPDEDFSDWLSGFERQALERGISQATFDAALGGVKPIDRVLELDQSQPRKPTQFCTYMSKRLTSTRIARGKRSLREHASLLDEISREYGVPARYLVALWGLETNFGDYMGEYSVMASLATLAWNPRRRDLFERQLLAALQIVDEGHQTPEGFLGSWAGAMGQVQFMPTTFLEFAVDHDGDGRKDLWTSIPDAFASAANYLRRSGWRSGETWGRRVRIPAEFDGKKLDGSRGLGEWQQIGVRRFDGSSLPTGTMRAQIVRPAKKLEPAFLTYRNYRAFKAWNNSTFFAVSVGTLADRIANLPSPSLCR